MDLLFKFVVYTRMLSKMLSTVFTGIRNWEFTLMEVCVFTILQCNKRAQVEIFYM